MPGMLHTPQDRAALEQPYDLGSRIFHWLVAALVTMQIVIALLMPLVLPESARDTITAWHLAVGSTVLLVMLMRLGWRLTHPMPPAPMDLPPALRLLARGTHWAFYGVLILLPVLGWVAANAYGATPRLLGLVPLPRLVAPDKPFAETVGAVHKTVALLLLVLVVLHISGALYHALVKRDGVIRRMLPR